MLELVTKFIPAICFTRENNTNEGPLTEANYVKDNVRKRKDHCRQNGQICRQQNFI